MPQYHSPISRTTVTIYTPRMSTTPHVSPGPLAPWVYCRDNNLILHDSKDCKLCHEWRGHFQSHSRAQEPSLKAAREECRSTVEMALKAIREEKDEEIAELHQKLKQAQRELEEVRQEKVSLRRGLVLGMLTATCRTCSSAALSLSPTHSSATATLSLSPTHPARVSACAAHPLLNTLLYHRPSLPHLQRPCQPGLLQVHHGSRSHGRGYIIVATSVEMPAPTSSRINTMTFRPIKNVHTNTK
jgi:hypothetical protein